MNERHAVIDKDGNVVNVIIWDGVSQWQPPADHIIVQHDTTNIGDLYDHATKKFTLVTKVSEDPQLVVEQPVTLDQRIADLEAKIAQLTGNQ